MMKDTRNYRHDCHDRLLIFIAFIAFILVSSDYLKWVTSTGNEAKHDIKVQPQVVPKGSSSPALRSNSSNKDHHKSKINIFYNLFIANKDEEDRVKEFIAEQLSPLLPEVHDNVWVTSIGYQPSEITHAKVVQHFPDGDEVKTLHELWEYCRNDPHHDTKVVYLHSKGSYHDNQQNVVLRRFLTKSALSQECADLPDQCDVCSARMSPIPHPHTPGNMWLARCDYIAKLVDPSFEREGKFKEYGTDNSDKGYGRFFYEHWVHMHPTVRPCDVSSDTSFTYGYDNIPVGEFEKKVQMAPRFDFYTFNPRKYNPPPKGPYLESMLSEFELFYNLRPDESWWGWKFFSD